MGFSRRCNSLNFHSFYTRGFLIIKEDLYSERFPSGQRGQTVNLLAMPSEVRTLPSPPGVRKQLIDKAIQPLLIPPFWSRRNERSWCACSGQRRWGAWSEWENFQLPEDEKRIRRRIVIDWRSLFLHKRGSSSVGRASAFQAEGRGFDPRFPLHYDDDKARLLGIFSSSLGQPVSFRWRVFLYLWPT